MTEVGAAGLDVFYPIVPDAEWLARLVPLGVRTVQLRLKDAARDEIRPQEHHGKSHWWQQHKPQKTRNTGRRRKPDKQLGHAELDGQMSDGPPDTG